jgi:Uma2 family endonuclease
MQVLDTIHTQRIAFSPLLKKYTLAEFWELPEPEDRSHFELIEGVLYTVPPPNEPHGKVVAFLTESLVLYNFNNGKLGTVYHPRESIYVEFEYGTYLEPDMMFVSNELEMQMKSKRTSADVVFEVLSDRTANYDLTTKADTYLALGVKELWLIDMDNETIEVRNVDSKGEILSWQKRIYKHGETAKSKILADWNISVSDVF